MLFQRIPGISLLLLAAVLLLCGSYFAVFENNELDTLDLRFRLRPVIPVSDKIVIVEIGDDTLQQLGRFPFDRSYHALIIKALSDYGAAGILFDIFFSEQAQSDFQFEQAIKVAGNVYLPYVFEVGETSGQRVAQASGYAALNREHLAKAAAGTGHINVIPDQDGKYRRIPLLIHYQKGFSPYLSFRLACDSLGLAPKDIIFEPGHYIQCGQQLKIPLDEHSNCIINYAGAWGKFYRHYSYVDVLRSYAAVLAGEKPILDLNVFRGKMCLIGLTATGTTDLHPNPFSSLYPALGVHADIINSLLQKQFITRAPKAVNLAILFVLLGFSVWIVFKAKPFKGFVALAGILALYVGICILLFFVWGLWMDIFYPLVAVGAMYFACLLGMYVRELKKRLLLENELKIAKEIQESFLPKSLPSNKGMEVSAAMYAARYVGGDLYDFYEFDPDRVGVVIGDVSGKGMPAALFMTTVTGALKFFALPEVPPQEALQSLNQKLIRESSANLFVTIFYAIFDLKKMVMRYANGGHLPVIYLTKSTPAQFLDVAEGFPLGMVEGPYSGNQIRLASGDIFVFYTDGITEALDAKARAYGKERLVALVEKNRGCGAQDLLSAIANDVRTFEPKNAPHDDITIMVLKIA